MLIEDTSLCARCPALNLVFVQGHCAGWAMAGAAPPSAASMLATKPVHTAARMSPRRGPFAPRRAPNHALVLGAAAASPRIDVNGRTAGGSPSGRVLDGAGSPRSRVGPVVPRADRLEGI